MPLKLKSLRKKKTKGGDGDSASIASGSSFRSQEGEVQDAYVIAKEKDLPKLHRAAWRGDLVKVKQMTKNVKKSDLNARDKEARTPLHLACARGHGKIIIHFCALKASINVADSDGCTPMHKVLESGCSACLQHLLDCGGDANMADKQGCTSLHVAAQLGNVEAATLLLERDARIDAIEKNGYTALHLATLKGHCKMVASLINDGADINARDGKGRTALMLAACDGRFSLVKLLTESKADPEVKDSSNFKAMDYAVTQNHQDCAHLIENHEHLVEREAMLLKQLPPRRTSLVDTSLISAVFGLGAPPLDHRVDDVAPSKSEDTLSHASQSQQDSWPASDTEDEDPGVSSKPAVSSKVNLRAGLERAKAVSPKKEPEVAPKPTSPEVNVSQPSGTALAQQEEEERANLHEDKQSPSDPLHFQLSTATVRKPEEGLLLPKSEDHSTSSDWDTDDDASLPLSSPRSPILPATSTFDKLGPGPLTSTPSPAGDDTNNPEGRHQGEDEQPPPETDAKPQEELPQETLPSDDEEVVVSELDSDFSMDGDLPDLGGYEPSTASDVGRSELLRQRSSAHSTPIDEKTGMRETPATMTSPVLTESSGVVVTPLSFTATTLDASNPNPGNSLSGVCKGTELLESGDSGDEIDRVVKELSFSEQKEDQKGEVKDGSPQEDVQRGGEEKPQGDEFDDSDWDTEEEEELEEELSGTALAMLDCKREPRKAQPALPKVDYFSYYDSNSEGEDEVENSVLPSGTIAATGDDGNETPEERVPCHIPTSPVCALDQVKAAREQKLPPLTVPTLPPLKVHTPPSLMVPMPPSLTVHTPLSSLPGSLMAGKPNSKDLPETSHTSEASEQKTPEDLSQSPGSGDSETESEWEREQRLKKQGKNLPELQLDSGLDTMAASSQASVKVGGAQSPVECVPTHDVLHRNAAALPPQFTPEGIDVKSPTSEATSDKHNVERIEHLLQGSLEENGTHHSTPVVPSGSTEGNPGHDKGPVLSVETETSREQGRPHRPTDDLDAARNKMEEEASRRFHERQNEFQILMKSRGKRTDRTWVSPRQRAENNSQQSPTHSPGIGSQDHGMETSDTGGAVLAGKSRVQLMKEMWESGSMFGQKGVAESLVKADSASVRDGYTHEQNSPSPHSGSRVGSPETPQSDVPDQETAPQPEVQPETEALLLQRLPPQTALNANNSSNQSGAVTDNLEDSEDEILELLSESGSEGEGEEEEEVGGLLFEPPLETKLPECVPEQGIVTPAECTENVVQRQTLPAKPPLHGEPQQVTPKVQEQPVPKTSSRLPNLAKSDHKPAPAVREGAATPTYPQHADQPLSSRDNVSDLSHACTPLPLTSPLTRSHLDSSPLHLHHLQLTPSHLTPHNRAGGQPGRDRMNLEDLSVSDLTNPAETHSHNPPSGSHDLPSESHDLPSGSHDPPSASNDPPSGSHDPPSESHDPPSESHDFSDASRLDDLPLSPLLHLSQSGMGRASMISSAHIVQLQESLREARRGLERSQDAQAASERSQRQVKAQLEELQKKYDDIYSAKLKLESAKLDMELQVRELRYQLEQEREGRHGSDMVGTQLREQLEKLERRVSQEMEGRQDAELRRRELEIEHHSFKIANQQLQDEVVDLTAQLQNERDARALQEGLYKEQIKMFQTLQEESCRAQQQKSEVLSQLQAVDSSKQGLEGRLTELQRTNAQLQVELAAECRRAEDHVTRLEGEVELLKERLQEKTEKQVLAENSLLEARQQFEAHLSELRTKAELLSSHLEEEATQRKSTEEEVSSLHSRLERTSSELQEKLRGHAEEQHRLKEAVEGAQREKMLVERDLSAARESVQQLQSRVDALEGRASLAEGEVKSQQALLLERANQIASLKQEMDHRNLQMSSLENTIKKEKDHSSNLEVQLLSASERLASSRSEVAQLRQQVEFAGRRAEEKEASALQTQEKFSAIFDSLRADQEKSKALLEERYHTLSEQLGAVREELVRKEVEASGHQQESDRLRQELSSLQEAQGEVEETLRATEEAYHELEEEKKEVEMRATELEEKVTTLEASLMEVRQQGKLQQRKVASLEQSLSHAEDSTRIAFTEKSSVAEQKSQLESEVLSLQGQLSHLQGELHGGSAREEQLRGQVEHLSQVRSGLEATASKLQGEVVGLQRELDQVKVALDRAVREAEEARGLWEMEVKSRSKLGMKVLEMERSQGDVNTLVDAERKKTHKALELKKVAELKCDSLHERNSQLQRELGMYRSQLKTVKKRTRELELNESQIPSLRAEFDREQSSLVGEVSALRRQLEETQDQLRREAEVRMKADLATGRSRQELEAATTKASLSQSEVLSKQKELRKMERSNRKLRDELKALQDHVTANMMDKRDMEVYRRAVEETARQELNTKLEEVNTHLEQQSQVQEAMERQRANLTFELRQKFERSSEELRMQLSQALADKQSLTAEGKRYKELYESELQRSERLSGHLQRAKEEAIESKTKLSLEKNRTQHLLNATHSAASHLSSSPYTPHASHPFTTSTPLKFNLQGDRSPTDDLLTSVRSELDKSIARHLDSVPPKVSATKATRSTYRKPRGNATDSILLPSKFSRDSHLDTIRSSYHI